MERMLLNEHSVKGGRTLPWNLSPSLEAEAGRMLVPSGLGGSQEERLVT